MNNEASFRCVYIVEPSHDFSKARDSTKRVTFLSTGDEKVFELKDVMEKMLEDFDPEKDAIIPMGRVSASLLAGLILGNKFPGHTINVGIFSTSGYIFEKVKM